MQENVNCVCTRMQNETHLLKPTSLPRIRGPYIKRASRACCTDVLAGVCASAFCWLRAAVCRCMNLRLRIFEEIPVGAAGELLAPRCDPGFDTAAACAAMT
eukprot:6193730-Pleurochrysis_carterae.AAC.1